MSIILFVITGCSVTFGILLNAISVGDPHNYFANKILLESYYSRQLCFVNILIQF